MAKRSNRLAISRVLTVIIISIIVIAAVVGAFYYLTLPTTEPTEKLKIAAVMDSPMEEAWNIQLYDALVWVENELDIEFDITESVSMADSYTVLSGYAEKGYKILIVHGFDPDAAKQIAEAYPDHYVLTTHWLEESYPPNIGHYTSWMHETSYLAGMVAGLMTKTNKIGIVAGYPVEDSNIIMNGIIMGAKEVNPEVHFIMTWIETWFDPTGAKEAAIAQIEAGADIIYAERLGAEQAAEEKGVFAMGQHSDLWQVAPKAMLTSIVFNIRPILRDVIAGVREGTFENKFYSYGLAENGTYLASYHETADVVPDEIKQRVSQTEQEILEGKIEITPIDKKPEDYWGEGL